MRMHICELIVATAGFTPDICGGQNSKSCFTAGPHCAFLHLLHVLRRVVRSGQSHRLGRSYWNFFRPRPVFSLFVTYFVFSLALPIHGKGISSTVALDAL